MTAFETFRARPGTAWHSLPPEAATVALGIDPALGLDEAEAAKRRAVAGPNALRTLPPVPMWKRFLEQFQEPLVLLLLGAAVLAWMIGEGTDTVVIVFVVVVNAILGLVQENRAEATLAALRSMLPHTARVRRGGAKLSILAEDLVPGDIVLLEAGDRIPADGRIVAAHNAEVSEAALTGESQSVGKSASELAPVDAPIAERPGIVFMNTVVSRGRLEVVVTATGMDTEMGKLTGMLDAAPDNETPLHIQLHGLGKRLSMVAVAVIAIMFVVELLRGQSFVQTAMTSVALAVAAIPEGLPAVVTVTLALGMHRMARVRAIVKKLAAVETLGCTTVICSDKTGTLTLNQMTARALWFGGRRFSVSGDGYGSGGAIEGLALDDDIKALLLPAVLCNDSHIADGVLVGDATEGALLALAAKGGVEPAGAAQNTPRIAEIPFDSEHKFMATFHRDGAAVTVHVKGAPEVLLDLCADLTGPGGATPLDAVGRGEVATAVESFGHDALRVLALATKRMAAADFDPSGDLRTHLRDLALCGFVGIIDPPRPEVRDAIAECRRAGIAVKMITGDHKITAAAVAKELALEGEVVSGAELNALDDVQLAQRIQAIAVIARATPEHKVRIVRALKADGEVVAMTGDGVNDAPALKYADIGVAMGISGTDVTKEAATLVLTDDNFATIVGAVEEGRTIYDNIIKFVRFQLATNFGALLAVFTAPFLGLPIPFSATLILLINIIMDGPPAMMLGLDPARPGLMDDAPRPREAAILTLARLARLLFFGTIMAGGTLALFAWAIERGEDPAYATTLAFATFVLFQIFNAINARAETRTAFGATLFSNGKLWGALAAVVALLVAIVHWDLAQTIFRTEDLRPADWGIALLVAMSLLAIEELRKLMTGALVPVRVGR